MGKFIPIFLTMQQFIKQIESNLQVIMEQYKKSDRHIAFRINLASKYNVDANLFRGQSFFIECARKQACRDLQGS